jgi:hypothetical protein
MTSSTPFKVSAVGSASQDLHDKEVHVSGKTKEEEESLKTG